jgi:hypothetical protein
MSINLQRPSARRGGYSGVSMSPDQQAATCRPLGISCHDHGARRDKLLASVRPRLDAGQKQDSTLLVWVSVLTVPVAARQARIPTAP